LQVVAGLGVAAMGFGTPSPAISFPGRVLQVLLFATVGSVLVSGTRRDPRPAFLGGVFLLVASAYTTFLLNHPQGLPVTAERAVRTLEALRVYAFLPLFVWSFVRVFPRSLAVPLDRRITYAVTLAAITGILLFVLTGVLAAEILPHAALRWVEGFGAREPTGRYWIIVYGLTLPALPAMVLKSRSAEERERRRVRIFLAGLALGALPPTTVVFLGAVSPGVANFFRSPVGQRVAMPLVQVAVTSTPLITTYSVLVDRVFEIRFLIRTAIRYTLARSTTQVASLAPFIGLGAYLYVSRRRPVGEVVAGPQGMALLGLGAAGIVANRARVNVLRTIDRLFYREQYDAHRTLSSLIDRGRSASSMQELAALLASELENALHPDSVGLLVRVEPDGPFRSATHATQLLDASSQLAIELAAGDPVDVDLEGHGAVAQRLPLADRRWLAETGFRLLVPFAGGKETTLGFIGLGSKRSELPYSGEDRELLSSVALSAVVAIERQTSTGRRGALPEAPEDAPASECQRCGCVQAPADACTSCGGPLSRAALPRNLLGKFSVERKLGAGSMGVVYRAIDQTLGRAVALKTLPRTTAEQSLRLRREARAMASVTHPHLAMIYGAETWRYTPLLVIELLENGTLQERLAEAPLGERETIELGRAVANVLVQLHSTGVLHRDIKPSNLAYTDRGVPKLLDFGVAQLLATSLVDAKPRNPAALAGAQTQTATGIAGTPLYMSPEALRGERAGPSFDLWSLSVVLYESVTGRHPYHRSTWMQTYGAIQQCRVEDVRSLAPSCSPMLAGLLEAALSPDERRRPATAEDLLRRLENVG